MAFANIAGTAGFVLTLDKSQLDAGLPEAERQFERSVQQMSASAQQMTSTGLYTPQQVNLAEKYGLTDLINQNDVLDQKLAQTAGRIREVETETTAARTATRGLAGGLGETAAGLASVAVKGTLYGLAITAAYQGSQRLQESLKTTGEEAFTTEGKLRNMGSALLSGDVIGAIEVWRQTPKTLEEAGISAREASVHLDALRRVMNGQVGVLRDQAMALQESGASSEEVTAAWNKYEEAVKAAGTSNRDLAAQAVEVGRAYRDIAHDVQTATAAVMGLRDAQGQLIVGFTPGQQFAVAAGTSSYGVPVAPPPSILGPGAQPYRPPPPRSLPQRLEDQMAAAARSDDIPEQIRIQRQVVAFTKRRLAIVDPENRRLWEERNDAYQQARTNLDSLEDQADRERQADADAADRKRKQRQSEAERRANEAARAYRESLDTHEQNLRNAYTAALQTPGAADDRRRYRELLTFLVGEGRDAMLTAGERAEYRGDVITLRGQRAQDIEQADTAADKAAQDRSKTQEQRLKNRVAAAELTKKTIADDLRALRNLRDYYRKAAKDKAGIWDEYQEAQFEYSRVETQKKIQAVLTGKEDVALKEIGPLLRDFMNWQTGLMRDVAPNVMGGNLGTHVLEQLTREQTSVLRGAVSRPRGGGRMLDEAAMAW